MSYLTPYFIDALHYEGALKTAIDESARYYDDPEIAALLEASQIEHWQLIAVKKERDEIKAELEFAQNHILQLEKDLETARFP
jgi:uncharacterized coiled-coil DUF342 family protein